jgi:long-chain acyl-CoA synthetase
MTSPNTGTPSLSSAVRHWGATRSEAVAVRCGDEALSWSELDDAMSRVAVALADAGIGHGDRIGLLGENSIEWVVAFLGCQRARIIVVPMNTRLAPTQVAHQIIKVGAKALLHDPGIAPGELASTGARSIELRSLLGNATAIAGAVPEETADVPALISFTSGTTGTPKGATITGSALSAFSHSFANYFGTGPDDSTLVLVPIFHNTGFADQLGHMIAAGATTNLLRRYRTDDAVAELTARPATFLAAVPSMLRMLMLHRNADSVFRDMRTIMYGGSSIPEAWVHELHRRWPHLQLVHAYGLSEFTSVCTLLPSRLAATKAESAGLPLPGVDVRIVDPEGADAATGEAGEVWVSGPTRMDGYWGEPELTAAKVDGRWLRTGDLGHVDADGLLWLHGRVDDVINRGGEKIMPTYVESQIARHPAIAAACAFGYPDEVLRHRIAVAVEIRPRAIFDEGEVRTFLRDFLPDYAIPDRWTIYDALPRNASGKFDRSALAADLMKELTA